MLAEPDSRGMLEESRRRLRDGGHGYHSPIALFQTVGVSWGTIHSPEGHDS